MGKPIANPSVSTFLDILKEDNRFVIPAYQREYTWRNEDKWRLIETIVHDINEDRKLTFLGGVILSQGQKGLYDTSYDIVDGQQRTITIVFILYCLYKIIIKLVEMDEHTKNVDLLGKKSEIEKYLKKRCSKLERQAQHQAEGQPEKHMAYILMNLPKDDDDDEQTYTRITDHLDEMKKEEEFLIKVLQQVLNLHSLDVENSKHFDDMTQEEDRKSLILEKASPQTPVENVLKFYEHFLDRVQFIQTIVQEEYAYDVFERFNTAGDPLTAFETFKPLVVYDLKGGHISQSYQKKISRIEDVLKQWSHDSNKTKRRDKTNKNTENFIIWFAYCFSGGKRKGQGDRRPLEKNLHMQREYLRGLYHKPIKQNPDQIRKEKERVIDKMWHLAEFIDKVWAPSDLNISDFDIKGHDNNDYKESLGEAAFCLDFLRAAKHVICIPLMAHFFEKFQQERSINNLNDFLDSIKICATFFCLWRSSRKTTGSVDERYKNIYFGQAEVFREKKDNQNQDNGSESAGDAQVQDALYKESSRWTSEMLRRYFCQNLRGHREYGISSSMQWAQRMINSRAGKLTHVSRFILLLASHDTKFVIENNMPSGSSKSGGAKFKLDRKKGIHSILNDDSWSSNDYKTLEHIVPMKRSNKTIDEEQKKQLKLDNSDRCLDCINSIGNLALTPKGLNSRLGAGSLCSKAGIILKNDEDKNEPYLFSLEFLKHIKPQDFDHKYIKARTEELARCAWEILAVDWLGWRHSK